MDWLSLVWGELALFAAVGFLVIGLDDVIVDLVWLFARKPDTALSREARRPEEPEICLAIFIPAWDEHAVISAMIARCRAQWAGQQFHLYVGVYPNDPATRNAVRLCAGPDLTIVVTPRAGPTTKADCLNALWGALSITRAQDRSRQWAVVLHDAEDLAHPDELRVYRQGLATHDMVQIPVMPLIDPRSPWVAGHYIDEFSEAHGKELVVRTAIGASLPSAGVGSALKATVLDHIAALNRGNPFDEDSLTEDYELGLRLSAEGFSSHFARMIDPATGKLIAVHACFPSTLSTAIRQKTRWITGIALAGWDRIGWTSDIAESWMRWRDRRSILSALVLTSGYLSMLLAMPLIYFQSFARFAGPIAWLFAINLFLLLWRLAFRAWLTGRHYGCVQAFQAIPRALVSSIIAVITARRAVYHYFTMLRTGRVIWDKTSHSFPLDPSR